MYVSDKYFTDWEHVVTFPNTGNETVYGLENEGLQSIMQFGRMYAVMYRLLMAIEFVSRLYRI